MHTLNGINPKCSYKFIFQNNSFLSNIATYIRVCHVNPRFISLVAYLSLILWNASFVYIDVGHGGFDGGATSLDGTILEKDVTLEVATYVANYLTKTGIKVKMTRTTDKALAQNKKEDMHKRVNLINESTCDIYVSIHANAYSASSIKGAQTFYNSFNLENEQFATTIMKYLQRFKILLSWSFKIPNKIILKKTK